MPCNPNNTHVISNAYGEGSVRYSQRITCSKTDVPDDILFVEDVDLTNTQPETEPNSLCRFCRFKARCDGIEQGVL